MNLVCRDLKDGAGCGLTAKRSHRTIIRVQSSFCKLACTMGLETAMRMREQLRSRAETIPGVSCANEAAADGIGIVEDGDTKQL